ANAFAAVSYASLDRRAVEIGVPPTDAISKLSVVCRRGRDSTDSHLLEPGQNNLRAEIVERYASQSLAGAGYAPVAPRVRAQDAATNCINARPSSCVHPHQSTSARETFRLKQFQCSSGRFYLTRSQ